MDKIKISIAQMAVCNTDVAENLRQVEIAVDRAIDQGADILLTPEGMVSGYHTDFDQSQVADAIIKITRRAKAGRLGLALGSCFYEDDGLCYNQLRFYDKDGIYLGCHTKTLTCGDPFPPHSGEVDDYAVMPLRTFDFHGVTIGGLICNDLWANPEFTPGDDTHLALKLKLMGAKMLFHAVNGGSDTSEFSQVVVRGYHESNLRMRARGYKLWIASVDNVYTDGTPNSCSSGVVSPNGEWALKLDTVGCRQGCFTVSL